MQEHAQHESRLPTVIVVNDDSGLRHALQFALCVEGFPVRAYATGAALLGAGDLPADACLVTDSRLPDMSGLDLVARLRTRTFDLPAILITTHPSGTLRRRAEQAGVAVVEQPLRGDSIANELVSLLGRLSGGRAC